jgi:hypothetical protein
MRRQGVRLMSAGVFMNAIVAEIEAEERQKTAECNNSKQE